MILDSLARAPIPRPIRQGLRWWQLRQRPLIPLFQRVVIELQANCNRSCFFCSRESDSSGKRKTADGGSVRESMPTDKVLALFDELEALSFHGLITFHHLSEAFLDPRLMSMAREARRRGMRPYVHTNGDVLRDDPELCRETAQIFDYVVVGLYDYTTAVERDAEKVFWKQRLQGTRVMFSLVEQIYSRTHSIESGDMRSIERRTYPTGICAEPQKYLMIHYNGDVAFCCEDMYGELLRFNVFECSLEEIWYSERHARLIRDLLMGERRRHDLCSNCTMVPNRYSEDAMRAVRHFDT